MADQTTEDIEFIPSDEIAEAEPDDTEQGAVHIEEREEPRGLMIVEAEDFEAEQLEETEAQELELEEAEELEAEAAAAAAGEAEGEAEAEEEVEEEVEEEHEEDLEETLRRHYGIVSEEPEEAPAEEPRLPRAQRRRVRLPGPASCASPPPSCPIPRAACAPTVWQTVSQRREVRRAATGQLVPAVPNPLAHANRPELVPPGRGVRPL